MPETRGEKLFFGVVMSITMAVGMEIYNVAISMGYALQPGGLSGMTNAVFPAALAEAAFGCCSASGVDLVMVSTVPDKPAFQHAGGHRRPAKSRATTGRLLSCPRSCPHRAVSAPDGDSGTKKLPNPDHKDKLVSP